MKVPRNDGVTDPPSLDALNEACGRIAQSRDTTKGVEEGFLAIKDALRFVLDPVTQPLSWILEFALLVFEAAPWWVMFPLLMAVVYLATKSVRLAVYTDRLRGRCWWRPVLKTANTRTVGQQLGSG